MGKSGIHCGGGFIPRLAGGAKAGTGVPGRGDPSGPRCGLAARAAWSDERDRSAMARCSRDICSEEASEGERTKAGAKERSNSEQSDQIT